MNLSYELFRCDLSIDKLFDKVEVLRRTREEDFSCTLVICQRWGKADSDCGSRLARWIYRERLGHFVTSWLARWVLSECLRRSRSTLVIGEQAVERERAIGT